MSDISSDYQENDGEFNLFSTDYIQEDEDACDVCKNVYKQDDLKEYDGVLVCSDCEQKGAEE